MQEAPTIVVALFGTQIIGYGQAWKLPEVYDAARLDEERVRERLDRECAIGVSYGDGDTPAAWPRG